MCPPPLVAQSRIIDATKQRMATVSELCMHQTKAFKLGGETEAAHQVLAQVIKEEGSHRSTVGRA